MSAAVASYPQSLVSFFQSIQFVNEKGFLTNPAVQALTQVLNFVNGTNRIIPCNCITTASVLALTQFAAGPFVSKYVDFEAFAFVADVTSADPFMTANVTTAGNNTTNAQTLATLNVYKADGATQAGSGDIVAGSLYLLFFNDALNAGAGGLVIK